MIDENVLIIGATGDLGIAATQAFLTNGDDKLTLFARSANRISIQDGSCESVFVGDVMSDQDLDKALQGQDAVFAVLSGNLGIYADEIVQAMERNGALRLVFITLMGIYNEIPASIRERVGINTPN